MSPLLQESVQILIWEMLYLHFLHNIDKMSRRIIGRFYGCMCGKGERSTANSQEGQRDFSRSIESVWYGFMGSTKSCAPMGRSFGTQKRLICAASIRSKMAAASRAAFSTSLWAAMP